MKKYNYLLGALLFLYFTLSDYPKFNILYNGITALISLSCIVLFFISKKK